MNQRQQEIIDELASAAKAVLRELRVVEGKGHALVSASQARLHVAISKADELS